MLFSTFTAMILAFSGQTPGLVDVGKINIKNLPALQRSGPPLPTIEMVSKVEQMLGQRKCPLKGQSASRFNINIPYAVLVEPNGQPTRVVVSELGCPDLETYAGRVVLELGRQGDFKATGEQKAKWYGGNLNFNLQ